MNDHPHYVTAERELTVYRSTPWAQSSKRPRFEILASAMAHGIMALTEELRREHEQWAQVWGEVRNSDARAGRQRSAPAEGAGGVDRTSEVRQDAVSAYGSDGPEPRPLKAWRCWCGALNEGEVHWSPNGFWVEWDPSTDDGRWNTDVTCSRGCCPSKEKHIEGRFLLQQLPEQS